MSSRSARACPEELTFSYELQFGLGDYEVRRAAVQAEDNMRKYEDVGLAQVLTTWEVDSDLGWKLDLA
jgi:hypothetical protein